ncbi:hypothetical protein T265_03846 [Opisthorchis viverrini]|uniref:RING-type domain-containing protein n=1 Tax=Opisthorchis viverrini TaxID=6198 RepID=A0A074ZUM3_OPIVI|nr:hypothetical protein T265_03846 [Opisthorchis viverrini]KER29547.1 hypothetical protein T265_03846 [Opisthorchis viverrini]
MCTCINSYTRFISHSRHVFHKKCVDPWLLEHRSCPLCKLDILKSCGILLDSFFPLTLDELGSNHLSSDFSSSSSSSLSEPYRRSTVGNWLSGRIFSLIFGGLYRPSATCTHRYHYAMTRQHASAHECVAPPPSIYSCPTQYFGHYHLPHVHRSRKEFGDIPDPTSERSTPILSACPLLWLCCCCCYFFWSDTRNTTTTSLQTCSCLHCIQPQPCPTDDAIPMSVLSDRLCDYHASFLGVSCMPVMLQLLHWRCYESHRRELQHHLVETRDFINSAQNRASSKRLRFDPSFYLTRAKLHMGTIFQKSRRQSADPPFTFRSKADGSLSPAISNPWERHREWYCPVVSFAETTYSSQCEQKADVHYSKDGSVSSRPPKIREKIRPESQLPTVDLLYGSDSDDELEELKSLLKWFDPNSSKPEKRTSSPDTLLLRINDGPVTADSSTQRSLSEAVMSPIAIVSAATSSSSDGGSDPSLVLLTPPTIFNLSERHKLKPDLSTDAEPAYASDLFSDKFESIRPWAGVSKSYLERATRSYHPYSSTGHWQGRTKYASRCIRKPGCQLAFPRNTRSKNILRGLTQFKSPKQIHIQDPMPSNIREISDMPVTFNRSPPPPYHQVARGPMLVPQQQTPNLSSAYFSPFCPMCRAEQQWSHQPTSHFFDIGVPVQTRRVPCRTRLKHRERRRRRPSPNVIRVRSFEIHAHSVCCHSDDGASPADGSDNTQSGDPNIRRKLCGVRVTIEPPDVQYHHTPDTFDSAECSPTDTANSNSSDSGIRQVAGRRDMISSPG